MLQLSKQSTLLFVAVALTTAAAVACRPPTPAADKGARPAVSPEPGQTSAPTTIPTMAPTPTIVPPATGPERIAFVSDREGGLGDIYVMNADGSGITNLTNHPQGGSSPQWSPDGERIAFISSRSGDFDIYVMNVDGSELRQLTDNQADDSSFDWSPDGTQIVFSSNVDGDYDIYVMNDDGSRVRQYSSNTTIDELDPVWSPDGSQIAFLCVFTTPPEVTEVCVMNADGSHPLNMTTTQEDARGIAWSPDGNQIAFVSPSWPGEIYVMNANATEKRQLTQDSADDQQPVWSPDGTKIAFRSDRDGDLEIYVMKADGSEQKQLTNNTDDDFSPVWSPDGTRIAFHSASSIGAHDVDIYVMYADGSGLINLTNSPSKDLFPDWQPGPGAASQDGQPDTRTLALPAVCPEPTDRISTISPIIPDTTVIDAFEPQILDYLNARGSAEGLQAALNEITLSDGGTTWQARTQVETVDVTGDTTPEVVMDLSFLVPGQYAEGGIFVFMCREGQYEGGAVAGMFGQVFSPSDPDPGIRAIQDMNGNGLPEIVFSNIEIIGTAANFTRAFRIIEWDGSRFVDLIEEGPFKDNAVRVNNGDGEIVDTDGNGTLELLLTNGPGRGIEPDPEEQSYVEIWGWDGIAFRLVRSG